MNLDRNLYLTREGKLCEDGDPNIATLVGLKNGVIEDHKAHELGIAEYLERHPLSPMAKDMTDVPKADAKAEAKAEAEEKAEAKAAQKAEERAEAKAVRQAEAEDKAMHRAEAKDQAAAVMEGTPDEPDAPVPASALDEPSSPHPIMPPETRRLRGRP